MANNTCCAKGFGMFTTNDARNKQCVYASDDKREMETLDHYKWRTEKLTFNDNKPNSGIMYAMAVVSGLLTVMCGAGAGSSKYQRDLLDKASMTDSLTAEQIENRDANDRHMYYWMIGAGMMAVVTLFLIVYGAVMFEPALQADYDKRKQEFNAAVAIRPSQEPPAIMEPIGSNNYLNNEVCI